MNGKAKLVGIVGAAAAATLLVFVPAKEGTRYVPYVDPAGILTVCNGSIRNIENRKYTPEECEKLLAEELAEHAEGALKCVNQPTTPGQRAAYTSLAFNIGVTAFCNSSVVRKHNQLDYKGACVSISLFNKATGNGTLVPLPGLTKRRAEERTMCEKDLPQ